MSRLFSQTPPVALGYKPLIQPVNLYAPTRQPPACVPVFINWTSYNNAGANSIVGVSIDMSSSAAGNPLTLDKISSVTIDNTGSNVPVYVYFPDTQYQVTAGPGQCVTANVATAGRVAYVYGVGFTGGPQPNTLVTFYNTVLQPNNGGETSYVQPQYFASTSNPNVANNTAYRPLAVGDQSLIFTFNPATNTAVGSTGTKSAISWPSGYSSQGSYVYITAIQATVEGWVYRITGGASIESATLGFFDTLGACNFTKYISVYEPASSSHVIDITIVNWTGLNLKIPCDSTNPFYIGYYSGPFVYYNTGGYWQDSAALRVQVICTLRNENTL